MGLEDHLSELETMEGTQSSGKVLSEVVRNYGIPISEVPETFPVTYVEGEYPPRQGLGTNTVPIGEYRISLWRYGENSNKQTLALIPPYYSNRPNVSVINDRWISFPYVELPKDYRLGDKVHFPITLQNSNFRWVEQWSSIIDKYMRHGRGELYEEREGNVVSAEPLIVVLGEGDDSSLVMLVHWFKSDKYRGSLEHRVSEIEICEI